MENSDTKKFKEKLASEILALMKHSLIETDFDCNQSKNFQEESFSRGKIEAYENILLLMGYEKKEISFIRDDIIMKEKLNITIF